ncbi:polyprenyl synthetase family protein [Oceanirhabdus sp. W0125-5]|uniref:polyprenyl synthetase family protein n=1 Tax=Oceanirhabdus sp. W0125-5 TaxID=2999116 RepID=UPI0022F2B25E|nr:farnesyl diphosphate synthase [Oceanirhabdus sp. W0125-5]WBW99770.1 polyprenyl synthetase family protein [Oceanirhabdus sp. W0125-5]
MDQIKILVDSWLNNYFKDKGTYESKIYQSMEYSIVNGGKRIRPILAVLTYGLYKNDIKEILPMACAIEMIHTYSLIHDDLPCMDDDDLRRGKPTNHKVYGEGLAVLAGDGLLNEAFNIMLKEAAINGEKHLEAATILGDASGVNGMIGGQVVDILSENKDISFEELSFIHAKKTGALLKSSILVGASIGGASKAEFEILSEFGSKIGLAFQIIDDILDVVGDENKVGKNLRTDSSREKNTYVKFFSIDECRKRAADLTNECFALLGKIDKNTEILEDLTRFLLERDY